LLSLQQGAQQMQKRDALKMLVLDPDELNTNEYEFPSCISVGVGRSERSLGFHPGMQGASARASCSPSMPTGPSTRRAFQKIGIKGAS
jgi:hypothetical protein